MLKELSEREVRRVGRDADRVAVRRDPACGGVVEGQRR
jgi:hypothetical protein